MGPDDTNKTIYRDPYTRKVVDSRADVPSHNPALYSVTTDDKINTDPISRQELLDLIDKLAEELVLENATNSNLIPEIGNQFMSASEKKQYLASPKWKALRKQRKRLANNACEYCGSTDSHKYNLHHITYTNLGEDTLDDVRYLCSDCHNQLHENAGKLYGDKYSRTNKYPLSLLDI